jgi:hypothetical protein
LARQGRRRLDWEAMRDGLLAAAGTLDATMFGRSKDLFADAGAKRRSVYGFIDRQNLPGTFRAFDFAGPDTHSPMRFQTTVPQQALFLMNSPFLAEQARALVAKLPDAAPERRVEALYAGVLGRKPSPDEIRIGVEFVKGPMVPMEAEPPTHLAWSYGYGRIDEASKKFADFKPFPHFQDATWRGGVKQLDDAIGWAMLTATGGHPGENPKFAVSRRWIAPRDMAVTVDGTLDHPQKFGDGVRARIISNRVGVLGDWSAHEDRTDTPAKFDVKAGDVIDFVVDCKGDVTFDGFLWSPVISGDGQIWDADKDFRGPTPPKVVSALGPWEQYAQALLLSNEFAFID